MAQEVIVEVMVDAPVEKVWEYWTQPEHIVKWNFASDDWCCPRATNDLHAGGKLNWRMEAKDGSVGFDFEGTYILIEEKKKIIYETMDGRKVSIEFAETDGGCLVTETFDAEDENSVEMQRAGWQSILNNFKKHVEKD